MPNYPDQVVDDLGGLHVLPQHPLGEGGQGVVFRTTSNPDVAVKLLPRRRIDLPDRLADVRALPLPKDLPIARPTALLRDRVGYTMPLMADMAPIKALIYTPREESMAAFYQATGGLRKRLLTLAGTAATLARLHAVPVVYADVSDNNVYVSKDPDRADVWLIDADNLTLTSEPCPAIQTPGFGAPEVVAGRGATTLSDAFAFAVLASWILVQHHPFLGDAAEGGGWDEEGEDGEELAFAGELPWIFDPDDDSNRSDLGIQPPEFVLSPGLRRLFQQSFGPGRTDPTARPGLAEWATALLRAADHTVRCPHCTATYYTAQQCPWCDATRPSFLTAVAGRWEPDEEAPSEAAPAFARVWRLDREVAEGRPTVVPSRVVRPCALADLDRPALSIEPRRGGLLIKPLDGEAYTLVQKKGHPRSLDRPTHLPFPTAGEEWFVHCGPLDRPHRTIVFTAYRS